MPEPARTAGTAGTSVGFGRVLVAVYAVFALAATARSVVQISTRFSTAPVAYLLSALAGVVYVVATVALARDDRRLAVTAIAVEATGVVVVGVLSLVDTSLFPDATVWSDFGQGYGFVPLVLPWVGLWWVHRVTRSART